MSRILVTGASGNLGRGLIPRLIAAEHTVVAADKAPLAGQDAIWEFRSLDLRIAESWQGLAEGCDLIVHAAAWHGIHSTIHEEAEFWNVNVGGTFHMFQAAQRAGVKAVVFLSSQAWHQHYRKYGFTKRVGEELCEYNLRNHDISYAAVRPYDFTPWKSLPAYGSNLLYGGVARKDVIDCTLACIGYLEQQNKPEGFSVNAVRSNAFGEDDLTDWEENPMAACERIFPRSSELVQKYAIDIVRKPVVMNLASNPSKLGWTPRHHFGTFIKELRILDQEHGPEAVKALQCPYADNRNLTLSR